MALDATRELLLRLVVQGSAEAKAALAEVEAAGTQLSASQEKMAVATEAATAAEKSQAEASVGVVAALHEQAAAATEVETILETKARLATQLANQELDAEARVAQARMASAQAMEALGLATVTGGKAMTAALLGARNAVAQLEVAIEAARATGAPIGPRAAAELDAYNMRLQAMSVETAKAASQMKILHAEASIASGTVGGLAHGVGGLGGEFSKLGLGLVAGLVALNVLPRVLDKVDEKTKEFGSAIANLVNGLHDEDIALRKSGESQEAYGDRVQKIRDLTEQETRARVLMGAGLIQEVGDRAKAIESYQAYAFAQHGVIQQFPELERAAKSMGIGFKATHEQMAHEAEIFFAIYRAQLKDGEGNATAWAESNKTALDKIVSYYVHAGEAVPPGLLKIAAAIGLVSAAEKEAAASHELRDKFLDEVNVATVLEAEIQRLAAAMGSEEAAARALAPLIEARIAALEKLKTANAADEAARKAALESLTALSAKYGLLEGAMLKVTSAADKALASWKDQQLRLAELNREYDNHARAVTAAADKSLDALNREADGVRTALTKQLADLRAAHDAGLIESSEYFTRVATITAALNVAMNAAATERERIQQKERGDLDALAEKHRETAGKIQEAQDRIKDAAAKAAEGMHHSSEQVSTDIDELAERAATGGRVFNQFATDAAESGQKVSVSLKETGSAAELVIEKLEGLRSTGNFASEALIDTSQAAVKAAAGLSGIAAAAEEIPAMLERVGKAAVELFGGGGAGTTGGGEGGGF